MDEVDLILEREDTPLQPQRGIATEGGLPVAIQVQFTGGRYPDKLLHDGSIEHIGEGRSGNQVLERGNKAMLKAIEERVAFPVYEKVGNRQYRLLGKYVAMSQKFRLLDPERQPDWRGYVFTLKPVWRPTEQIPGSPSDLRGGQRPPRQQDVAQRIRVEMFAMEAVRDHYERMNYLVIFVHRENLGWDCEATRADESLQLEVKGVSGPSLTVELTPNEYRALKNFETYRVCVVNNALSELRKVHVFTMRTDMATLSDESGKILQIDPREGAILRSSS